MRLAIFGATGRTGRLLVEQALAAGHEVNAFARDPAKLGIEGGRLSVVQGDATDVGKVREAISGAGAVLGALGQTKGSARDVQSRATQNIVRAMGESGVRRLVSLTGAGVRDSRDEPKVSDRVIVAALGLLQGAVLEDGRRHAEIIRASELEWVIVRAPMLTDGERTGNYRVGYVGKDSGSKISRADVAEFMLGQITDDTYLRTAPMVSYGRRS